MTLAEALETTKLTKEGLHNLLPPELRDLIIGGVPYTASPKDIADAQHEADKQMLWWVVDWMKESPGWHDVELLEADLIDLGIERKVSDE